MYLGNFWGDGEVKNILKLPAVRKYLTIVNISSDTIPLQIEASSPFALADTTMYVQSHYGDTEV
jgi:hypothetical protein